MVTFKVQADRIQSNDEANEAWVAVKLSTEMLPPPGAPTLADVDALLPWKWQTLAGGMPWDPHIDDAWALWRIDPANPAVAIPIPPANIKARSQPVTIAGFETSLDAAVAAISTPQGNIRSESLCLPDPDKETPTTGTVPGFVERLATAPHPVPSAAKVHALLAVTDIPTLGTVDGLQIIAAPRVTPAPGQPFDATTLNPVYVADANNPDNVHWTLTGPTSLGELKASRIVSDMRADRSSGRVLDLFDQTIAVIADPMRTLPTAEALATLPQALADAMDPLARLQSVLSERLRAWVVGAPGRREVVGADLGLPVAGAQAIATSQLKLALDAIAVQVLGTRYDAVGRFEVPLFEALESKDDAASISLLTAHRAAAPAGADRSACLAAWRTIPATIFRADYRPDGATLIGDASPLTLDQLRQQAGFAVDGLHQNSRRDVDVLRVIWKNAAETPAVQPADVRGLRYLELPSEQPGTGSRPLQLVQRFRALDPLPAARGGGDADPLADVSFDRARASAALAYAAPFIEGLVSGRADWSKAKAGDVTTPLHERFEQSMRALLVGSGEIEGLYRTLATQAAAAAGLTSASPLWDLIIHLLDAAAEDAIALAAALGPRIDPFDTVTQLPLPLSFQIDQMQTFSRHVDDWTRLSGYGLLVRRTGAANPTPWISLNAAAMYFGLSGNPITKQDPRHLTEIAALHNARTRVDGVAADGTPRAFVDPHPFAPGDQVGVSDAIGEYANTWQTAPMPGQAALGQDGGGVGVEAARFVYGPPGNGAPKLPTLSFGRRYQVRAHLVVQGGVLARFARDPRNPYVLRPDIPDAPALTATTDYLRTVAISAPSFATDAPPPPAGVSMLVDELPKRTAARQMGASELRMNRDPAKGVPLVACAPGAGGGLRFTFVVDACGPARIPISVEAPDQADQPSAIDIAGAVAGQWYRIDVFRNGNVVTLTRAVGLGAEDEFRATPDWVETTRLALPYHPEAVSLRLGPVVGVEIEPMPVALIASKGGTVAEIAHSGDGTPPRSMRLLLDGLDASSNRRGQRVSNGLVRPTAMVEVRGPSLDRHTWERWVNCALFAGGVDRALRTRVATMLDELQAEGADARTDLADPAVGGLWLELWEIFPRRERIGAPLTFFAERADLLARPVAGLDVAVGDPASPGASFGRGARGRAAIQCLPGRVYEIRASAVVRANDAPFDGISTNKSRLGSAVLGTCSEVTVTGDTLLLGPAVVLPVEVATAALPELQRSRWLHETIVPLRADGDRRLVDLKFPAALFTGDDGGRCALRYCETASLVPQHWTWRGRPDPQGEAPPYDRAFAGRRNDDHGSLVTGKLHVAHALALEPTGASEPPTIVSRDLDWRGGWNLWRFGVRLTSRYRPLFQSSALDLAFNELHRDKAVYRWRNQSVPDAANGRTIAKPPLILILPLTESDTDDDMVPPLLALIAEPMHANGNFGDGVAVAVEMARHPFPAFQRDPAATGLPAELALKYLPEVGPDPIRSGKAHNGEAVALRLDGPVGYGFDLGSEAGTFTHSGFVISPIRHKLNPWSMIKLKMRRVERSGRPPLGLEEKGPLVVRDAPSAGRASAAVPADMPFEGLVIHPSFALDAAFNIKFHRDDGLADGPAGQRVELVVSQDASGWLVRAWVFKVDVAHAADWMSADKVANAGSFRFSPGSHLPRLRLIVSARAKPERDAEWTPSGEVMIQVNLGDGEVEDGGNGWLTIFALPIEADYRAPVSNNPRVLVSVPALVERVRMSDYSPSVWCQFTVASSNIRLMRDGGTGPATDIVSVEHLDLRIPAGTPTGDWTKLVLHEGGQARLMAPDVAPEPDAGAEMTEVRVALFTEDAFDISGQIRERPVAAVLLSDVAIKVANVSTTVTGVARVLWQDDAGSKPGRPGRWRLLRILRRGDEIQNLADLFAEPLDSFADNPADAPGMILTVSRPFPPRK